MSSELPPYAVVPEEVIIPGEKKCEKCTHYISEHMENGPCRHLMFEIITPEDKQLKSMGHMVHGARQLCSCRGFEE